MNLRPATGGFTLIELMFTTVLISVLGLIIYSLLNTGMVLGAKNTAVNTAHQQARVAMLEMLQELHSSVSLPALANASGTPYPSPVPVSAEGITFQQWSSGPHKILSGGSGSNGDYTMNDRIIHIRVTGASSAAPVVGQRLIIPTHQIEGDVTAVSGTTSNLSVTMDNFLVSPGTSNSYQLPDGSWAVHTLPVAINGTGSAIGDIVCMITERCSYTVANNALNWARRGLPSRSIVNDVTNNTPFSTPATPAGAPYNRVVAAIDLSTADLQYNNRGFRSANILLNGQVPIKTQLTHYQ
jgi:prepilin-type N-terminal cleavage/methylation domain-containing protein